MPIATVDPGDYIRVDLKSCPPDGYVMLRPLPYGQKLKRRDKTTKMVMRAQAPEGSGRGRMASQNVDAVMEFESAQEWAAQFDFEYCIGDHNLTDNKGQKLDLTNPMHVKLLNPRIGSEIEEAIAQLNELEDEESLADFTKRWSDSLDQTDESQTDSGAENVT